MRFVYIVDDDRLSREVTRLSVSRDINTLVRTFESGVDFIDEAGDLDPGVVLLDLNMPELDGTEVLEQLKKRADDKFVTILVSSTSSVPKAVSAMKYGALDVLGKPIGHEALTQTLASAFERLDATRDAALQRREGQRKIASLSARELTVLQQLYEGCSNKETALNLGLSPRTVEIYRAIVMRKLDVHDVAHLVRLVVAAGGLPE